MNQDRFQRVLGRYLAWIWVPLGALLLLGVLVERIGRDALPGPETELFGLPLLSIDGSPSFTGTGGPAVISVGGFALGLLALGGTAVGVIACGGGAVGLIACGGGAIGLIAVGGGAFGYIAIGGGACGVYVLAGDGAGRYVFSRKRQDKRAVDAFCRYLPRLRTVFPPVTGSARE